MKAHLNLFFKKNKMSILLNTPCILGLGALMYNPALWQSLISCSGYTAFAFLFIVLILNPLKSAFPTWVWVKKINRYRRYIGVAACSYAALHVLCFIIKRGNVYTAIKWITHPVLFPGFIAFCILIPLALTSNNFSIKKLKFVHWKCLHKKVYLAEIGVLAHMTLWQPTPRAVALVFGGILILFQSLRYVKKQRVFHKDM